MPAVVALGVALVPATSVLATGTASAAASVAAAVPHVAKGGTWGTAKEVPGLGALNTGGDARIETVSCPSAGNCGAGGSYADGSGKFHAFVVSESIGTWAAARQVTGSAGLLDGGAAVNAASCGSAGNCGAAGDYNDSAGDGQVFVVSQVSGAWGTAEQIPGTAALNTGGEADVAGLSCASAGNCSAVGTYKACPKSTGCQRAFVADEVNGTWGKAREVPGLRALAGNNGAQAESVSCASPGNCAASGTFGPSAFVVTETNGTWGKAIEVPGLAALATGGGAQAGTVSCGSPGNCSAGGSYTDGNDGDQAFVVTETNGTWGKAIEVPGTAALNTNGRGDTTSLSCASAGNCLAGGDYNNRTFVATETNGTWGTAIEVPGTRALNKRGGAETDSVSCAFVGNCSIGGIYVDTNGNFQAWVASEANGTWSNAIEVPGTARLNQGESAGVSAVSCGAPGNCAAVGTYTDKAVHEQSFVANES